MDDQFVRSAEDNVQMLNEAIDQYITMEMRNIDHLSKQLSSDKVDLHDAGVRETIDLFTSHHPELELVTLGTETGAWMKSPDPGPQDYDPRERGWYKATKAKPGEVVVSDPYVSATTGNVVVTIAKVLPDGKGVAGGNLSLATLAEITAKARIGTEGYSFMMDRSSVIVVHPTLAAGEDVKETDWAKQMTGESGSFGYTFDGKSRHMVYVSNSLTGWKIGGTFDTDEIQRNSAPILNMMLIVLLVSLLVGSALVYLIVRSTVGPLKQVIAAAENISQGDLTQRIPVKRHDEVGRLSESFNQMADSLREVLTEVGETSAQLAASSEQLMASSEQTSSATEHIATSIQEMAAGAEQQVLKVGESSDVVADISSGIGQIAASAQTVSGSADQASEQSGEGGRAIQTAVRQINSISGTVGSLAAEVKELNERSQEIGNIVQVITDIAQQTNLLSLNAAIEASRAGEQGRGFAVVAAEVRKLAEQSAGSAQQIAGLIAAIRGRTEKVVQAVDSTTQEVNDGLAAIRNAGEQFSRIQESIGHVAQETKDVSASSRLISEGARQVVAAIDQVSEIAKASAADAQSISAASQQQLASMEEIAASSAALTQMADGLEKLVKKFKL
ncbi:methyl-accepting chemotaxis protein [Paenibacillus thermotolerans]|uniref:methyl-accepting chemotaxis protein n=1 Tax=Paenibacillus thermotolerans TaxID=3027807 RepID=UPI0023674D46|nr:MULTISPECIES: methyl-accepting chemotaxis protein [unclassified Paenibacillus]